MPINPEILAKLNKLYGKKPLTNDIFGRRPATAKEIEQMLSTEEPKYGQSTVDQYLPTENDLTEKGD